MTGGSEPPKIDTTETFPMPEEKLPITSGGETKPIDQGPIILYNKKAQLKEFKDTFDKALIAYDQKKMPEVVEITAKKFAQKLSDFIDTNYDGRLEPAVKDMLGVTEKQKK